MRWSILVSTAGVALFLSACGDGGTTSGTAGNGGSAGAGGTGGASCVVDGKVQGTEQCDDGNKADGDGCDNDCTFSCEDPAKDCPAPAECSAASCSSAHVCESAADPALDGKACGSGGTCHDGACVVPGCGNGYVEDGEDCDFGASNGPGTGCESDCKFSCDKANDPCPDDDPCNGIEACTTVMVESKTGQKCMAGAPAADCTLCAGGVCKGAKCAASQCDDGCVDPAAGEGCEPPGSATCDAACKKITPQGCGDGVRSGAEQCDDGNNKNMDGCDYTCAFEQDQRTNFVELQFMSDAFCGGHNAIGSAIASVAQSTFQQVLAQGIKAGTSGVLFKIMSLDDLSGQKDDAAALGVVGAALVDGAGYDGNKDLDWWYTVDPMWLDANRDPVQKLFASFSGGVLNAGPGNVLAPNFISSSPPSINLFNVKLQLAVGAPSKPTVSAGTTPGHLAAENLDPALTSFQDASMPSSAGAGKLCADVSAASLAQAPVPSQLLPPSQTQCNEGYTAQSSLLDLLVGGCKVVFVQAVNATQPDKLDPTAPVLGAGGPYTLTADAAHKVNGCKDKDGAAVDLAACLNTAAYSGYFRVATDRVILK